MSQTEIAVNVPKQAKQGEIFIVEVTIYNRTTNPEPHNIDSSCPVVRAGSKTIYVGDERNIPPEDYGIPAFETWEFNYKMPSVSITLTIESWFESYYYDWHLDTKLSRNIELVTDGEPPPEDGEPPPEDGEPPPDDGNGEPPPNGNGENGGFDWSKWAWPIAIAFLALIAILGTRKKK